MVCIWTINMKEDIKTRNILSTIRNIQEGTYSEKNLIVEDTNDEVDDNAIAITDDPKFGQQELSNQIQQFRTIVDGSAQFAKPSDDVADCPLIYMPKTGNLIFSGTIPRLNNLKFQFKLRTNTGNGCFIWADGLILSKDNMVVLNKLSAFYINWMESWNSQSSDLEMLNNMND